MASIARLAVAARASSTASNRSGACSGGAIEPPAAAAVADRVVAWCAARPGHHARPRHAWRPRATARPPPGPPSRVPPAHGRDVPACLADAARAARPTTRHADARVGCAQRRAHARSMGSVLRGGTSAAAALAGGRVRPPRAACVDGGQVARDAQRAGWATSWNCPRPATHARLEGVRRRGASVGARGRRGA
jgi:hypothetical protein